MAETRTPVETTTRYATTVNELTDAWAFVMERLDRVGADPSVHITPTWVISDIDASPDENPRHFEVVVEGMVEEK